MDRLRLELALYELIEKCETVEELNENVDEVADALRTAALDVAEDMCFDNSEVIML